MTESLLTRPPEHGTTVGVAQHWAKNERPCPLCMTLYLSMTWAERKEFVHNIELDLEKEIPISLRRAT